MMAKYFFFGLLLTAVSASSSASDLEGTWTTKSRQVVTGPVCFAPCCLPCSVKQHCRVANHLLYTQGFYDPINDKFLEPNLTGISYSFSADGHYEEAYYRAIANRQFQNLAFMVFFAEPIF